MLNLIKELFHLLNKKQKKQFIILQVLVVLMSLTEVLSVVSIGSFVALISNIELLKDNGIMGFMYAITSFTNPYDFLFWFGVTVVSILFLSVIFSILTTWKLALFANNIGVEIGDRLYNYYIHQSWLYHASNNSSELTKKIAFEADRMTMTIIVPLMQLNAKFVLALFLSVLIFTYNPLAALIGFFLFSSIYTLIYKIVRSKLSNNSLILSQSNQLRYKLISEVFGGIKDVLLLGRQNNFNNQFKETGLKFGYSRGTNQALVHSPRYIVEFIAFSAIVFSVLYLINEGEGNLTSVLPMLSIYAMAGFKLLPAFQQIYSNISTIKGNMSAFESIKDDLLSSQYDSIANLENNISRVKLSLKKDILFKNVTFNYPSKDAIVLDNINLKFPVNKSIGLVGASGSGKSTIIDLLSGLIEVTSGEILIDDVRLTKENLRLLQNNIGYVSQSIFLSDGTIGQNIAFGLKDEEIDFEKVAEVVKLSHLDEFVYNLENGIETQVGERGVQLSGGQRQRIGIARALYNDADILILDEATSALDGITEKIIMDAIHDFSGNKTIIMIAHRLKTVAKCDNIYLLGKGYIIDEGTYDELILTNETFKNMAKHS